MSKIINLNQARKSRAKATDKARAAANRAAFGRTKAEKALAKGEAERARQRLDGARRDDD